MSEPSPAIEVRSLWKRYGNRDVLRRVDLTIPAGTCHVLLGPNGAGKTTLFRVLSTLAHASEGEVSIAGHALPKEAAAARAKVGVLLDHHLLPRELRLGEALRYYGDLYGLARTETDARIEALLTRFGLATRIRDPIRTFSRGMAQAAGLCRALLHEPSVLLLDEPFASLDVAGCRVVEEIIRERRAAGAAVVLVTHDVERGIALADAATVLVAGRVEVSGDPAAARARLDAALAPVAAPNAPAGTPTQAPAR